MQSFSDYNSCEGPYPWLGAHECTGASCAWVDGSEWVRSIRPKALVSTKSQTHDCFWDTQAHVLSGRLLLGPISASIMRRCICTRTANGAHTGAHRRRLVSIPRSWQSASNGPGGRPGRIRILTKMNASWWYRNLRTHFTNGREHWLLC